MAKCNARWTVVDDNDGIATWSCELTGDHVVHEQGITATWIDSDEGAWRE